jgi:hypothetical protein
VFSKQAHIKRLGFGKGFTALCALKPLHNTVFVLETPEFAAFAATAHTVCHFWLDFLGQKN